MPGGSGIKIKPANLNEIDEIMRLCIMYYKESDNYSEYKLSTERLSVCLLDYINDDDTHVALSRKNGELVGISISHLYQPIWSEEYLLENSILYVHPQHRTGTGLGLIRDIYRYARAKGAKSIFIGTTSGITTDKTVNMYRALGFKHIGYDFKASTKVKNYG